jgi:hypothetical protein
MRSVGRLGSITLYAFTILGLGVPARADEIWVAPTAQQDLGGLGIGSNTFWPATAVGAVRLAWSVPDNLKSLQSAKVVLIPHSPGTGPSTLTLLVCSSKNGDAATANCAAPSSKSFVGVANQLMEIEVASILLPYIGSPGANYLAVVAFTTPTTATDHIVGLRFGYEPLDDSVATLAANTFSGTQTAPAFVGDGSKLTGLPFPAGAATLGANTFSGIQTAPAFAGSGASLTGVAKLGANTFAGTQTIGAGHLDLERSTATTGILTKAGQPFLHDFGTNNVFLGKGAGFFEGNFMMSGSRNVGVGDGAMQTITSGTRNVAYGVNALFSAGAGDSNVAVGTAALSNTGGSRNVAVGDGAGFQLLVGSNNIYVGYFVSGASFESDSIHLGDTSTHTKTVIAGIRGITTASADAIPVVIDSNGQLGTVSSSIRFKEDVHDMADVSQRLMQLRPVTFRYTQAYSDGAKPIQYGLIAEEVAEVFPELAVRGADGQVETVHYETLNVLLLNELQKQQAHLDDQAIEQKKQADRIEALEQQLGALLSERAAGR